MATASSIQRRTGEPGQQATVRPDHIRRYLPDVDIIETADEFLVVADVPGATAENVNVQFEHGQLSIRAAIPRRRGSEGKNYLLQEYGVGDYERTFQVREDVTGDGITAEIKEGVLTVRLPKAAAAKTRKIEVTGS